MRENKRSNRSKCDNRAITTTICASMFAQWSMFHTQCSTQIKSFTSMCSVPQRLLFSRSSNVYRYAAHTLTRPNGLLFFICSYAIARVVHLQCRYAHRLIYVCEITRHSALSPKFSMHSKPNQNRTTESSSGERVNNARHSHNFIIGSFNSNSPRNAHAKYRMFFHVKLIDKGDMGLNG